MVVIGIDPHKRQHTAAVLDQSTQRQLGALTIAATLDNYRRLLAWSKQWPQRSWAVENARGLGRHLAQWLIARGETVTDVPATATTRVRELSRGGRRKNDVIDAAAAASVAALLGDAAVVVVEDITSVLGLLDERRVNLAAQRTRLVNQLHALLRDLLAGGAPTQLTAAQASDLLRPVRPAGAVERVRKELARDMIAELRDIDARIKASEARTRTALNASGSRLTEVAGIGPVLATRILGRTGRPDRFPSGGHYASYTGTAPIQVASAEHSRHRLSRSGDRQLNAAIHLIAVTQVRMPASSGHAYYVKKLAEGKSRNEALRCLKRQLAEHLWRIMMRDHTHSGASHPATRATDQEAA
jgi:transposase